MSPEWQRRTVAIFLTVLSIAPIRKIEPILAEATGLNGVWITRVTAIAILILCFKLADMIPDDQWRFREPGRPRAAHLGFAALCAAIIVLSHGAAH